MMESFVLVVDDDRDIRDTLVELLEEHGFPAKGASNGLEALEHASSVRVRTVLNDFAASAQNSFAVRVRSTGPSRISVVSRSGWAAAYVWASSVP